MNDYIGYIIGVALVIIVILLVLREFRCWYWKVNEIISLLERIDTKLGLKNSPQAAIAPDPPKSPNPDDAVQCPKCGQKNTFDTFCVNQTGEGKCPFCGQNVVFKFT